MPKSRSFGSHQCTHPGVTTGELRQDEIPRVFGPGVSLRLTWILAAEPPDAQFLGQSPASFRGEHGRLGASAPGREEGSLGRGGGASSGVQLTGVSKRALQKPHLSPLSQAKGRVALAPGVGEPPQRPSVVASLGQPRSCGRAGKAIRYSLRGLGGPAGQPGFGAMIRLPAPSQSPGLQSRSKAGPGGTGQQHRACPFWGTVGFSDNVPELPDLQGF